MSLSLLLLALLSCLLVSGFFSGSETAMMSQNKYRLRHLAQQHHRSARRAIRLLKRPDRLLGVILLGNTFANIAASAFLTTYAENHLGPSGILLGTVILTIAILLFSEILPKTLAAFAPQPFAFIVVWPLKWLLNVLYPIVWLLNIIANAILKMFRIHIPKTATHDPLSKEEMLSVVDASKEKLGHKNRHMLEGVLALDDIIIRHVMVPKHQIEFIDLNASLTTILRTIAKTHHSVMLACYGNINNTAGLLYLKEVVHLLTQTTRPSQKSLIKLLKSPYFIPETVSLKSQLIQFQTQGCRMAIVVNEYGDITGMVTLEDIIEEIVGEFSDRFNQQQHFQPIGNIGYTSSGETTLRELNRHLDLQLPTSEAKTLSGFILERLGHIPVGPCCLKINGYFFEVYQIQSNFIKTIKIYPSTEIPAP